MSSLKQNSAATVDELRQFLDSMRGKSAKEVLGKIAESGLIKAVIQATLASAVLIGVFTVGPYMLYGKKGATGGAAAAKSTDGTATDANATGTPAASGQANAAAGTAAGSAGSAATAAGESNAGAGEGGTAAPGGPGSELERAAKMMGVGDTKSADPKANPRERDLDNLLDKIK
jgi:hypothetical protein